MSNQVFTIDLLVTLSDKQQELLAGGADFELSGSNYANRLANLQGFTASGPAGSTSNSIGNTSAVNTASQDLLGLGASSVPPVGALGAAPVLDNIGGPTFGGQGFINPLLATPFGGLGLGGPGTIF